MAVTLSSPPTQCEILSDESIYKAVKDFELLLFSDLEDAQIFAGNQNNLSLPPTREYIINTIINHRNIGTPVQSMEWNEETQASSLILAQPVELMMQIDAYSNSPEKARLRAETVTVVGRSVPGVDFFARYGLSTLFADDAKNLTGVGDENQFVQRWMTTLHLIYTHRVQLDVDSFSAVKVDVQNVDVKFPPK